MLPDRKNHVRIRANFPGAVELRAHVGDHVERGSPLVVIEGEAEIETLSAREAATVAEVLVREGDEVTASQLLMILDQEA